jgi:hypothetical protein
MAHLAIEMRVVSMACRRQGGTVYSRGPVFPRNTVRERGKPFIDKWAVFHFFTALETILAHANAGRERCAWEFERYLSKEKTFAAASTT